MPYLETEDGTPLHFVDKGRRSAAGLILIHAEPFSIRFWQRNIPVLARDFRVVAMDVRGRGESGKTDFGHTIPQYARDLDFMLRTLGLDKAVAVGWSLGGSIVWSHMEQFGQARLAGYVNVDQAPRRFVSEEHLQQRLNSIRTGRLAFHRDAIRSYFGPAADCDEATVKWMVYECMKTPTPYHVEAVTNSYRSDFTPHMARVSVPMDAAIAGEMRSATPGSELFFFETCGHLIPWVEAERFNLELAGFAQRVLG